MRRWLGVRQDTSDCPSGSAEEVGNVGLGMSAFSRQFADVTLLGCTEFRPPAFELSLSLGDGYAFAGTRGDQVASNSGTIASVVNMSLPTGSVGS